MDRRIDRYRRFLVKETKRGIQVEYLSMDRRIDGYRRLLVKETKQGIQVE